MNKNETDLKRWRLILGEEASPETESSFLSQEEQQIDQTLSLLYDAQKGDRKGGLQASRPQMSRWLGDIRTYFPKSVVQVMQKDALERLGLRQMLLEPELLESLEPDVHLVSTLLSLSKVMPKKTRQTAREVVAKVVEEIEKKLKQALLQAIRGSLSRAVQNRHPRFREIDWWKTLSKNMKNYQPSLQTIIPEKLVGMGRKGSSLKEVILCVDQSASMASSLVYASIFGAVLASVRALKTSMFVFDTSIVDLTKELHEPVDLLFGTQLGGGTDINKALGYAQTRIERPQDTILILISDLFEGGNQREMLKKAQKMKASGVNLIVLLALDDAGAPSYDGQLAQALTSFEIPCFACSPDKFPDLMAAALEGRAIRYV